MGLYLYYYETTEQTFFLETISLKCELSKNELYHVKPKQSTIKVPGGDSAEAQ